MQFSKKEISSVTTEYSVTIPSQDVQKSVDQWLERKAATVRMAGFRKGKAPVSAVRKQYGGQAEAAVIQELVQQAAAKVLSSEKLVPVTRPTYRVDSYDPQVGIAFTLSVELQPEFELQPLEGLKIEKIRCDVTDEEIDAEFKKFSDDFQKPVNDAQKTLAEKDFAFISMEATCHHKAAPQLSTKRLRVSINEDAGQDPLFLAVIAAIKGKKQGDSFEVKFHLPKDFRLKQYAGRNISIKGIILEVYTMAHAEFTEEEAKSMGFKDLAAFKDSLGQMLRRHRQNSLKICYKRSVLDALAEQYDFDVPPSVVAMDFRGVWHFVKPEIDAARLVDDEDVRGKTDEDLEKEYRAVSVRRVRLGFVIRRIAAKYKVELTQDQLQQALAQEIERYPGEERTVLRFYQKNPSAVERLVAPIIEDQVIDKILELADAQEKIVTKEELDKLLSEILPD